MARKPARATPARLKNRALAYLGRYASSVENLRRVLMAIVERSARVHGTDRVDGAAAVEALVTRFAAAGLVDDRTYAEGRVRALRARGTAARAIRARLMAKGVDRAAIDQALAVVDVDEREPDVAAATALARRRRLGPYRPPAARPANRQRDLAALARAGFACDISRRVIEAASADLLLLELGEES